MHTDDIKLSNWMKGGKTCSPGKVLRSGYTATRKKKTFIGRLFKRGTTYRVGPTCIKNRGVIGPLKKGALTDKGYDSTESADQRHAALAKAVGAYGRLSTLRKLNAVAVLNKNTSPARSKTFKADRNWVKKTYF
jgi:hypothetical protein